MRTREFPQTRLSRVRAIIAGVAVAAVLLAVAPAHADAAAAGVSSAVASNPARTAAQTLLVPAADLRQFNAGNIMSDEVFFNPATMSEGDIDAFLRGKVTACRAGYVCLKDFRQSTTNKAADAYCDGYAGAGNEPAARIIYKVAVSCGINPQVLLATLQKEQGLVTHVWPSDFRYRSAMGQGCPDTAGCDARYYGFQNQVYGAARQFQIYAEGRYFTYYAPGKTWNIRYNPNAACGSAPVTIANRATAGLYYYTPYQPNTAALNAGYGEGDGCSAYGNRNFYQYFVDWFGSTQTSNMTIVKTGSSPDVFLISGGNRWRIADAEAYGELVAAYGPLRVVSESAVNAFALKGTTSAVLRDPATGTMAIVQGGQTHRLASCELVARWGGSCTNPTTVTSALFSRLPAGAEAGNYFRIRGTERWGRFESTTHATPVYDGRAAAAVSGTPRSAPYAPYISASRYASMTKSAPYYAPLMAVKSASSPKVYVTVDFDKLIWVRAWSEVAEYGIRSSDVRTVAAAELSRYTEIAQPLAPTLRCIGATYFAGSGTLHAVPDPAGSGLAATEVGAATCGELPKATTSGPMLAVKSSASPAVFVIQQGRKRQVLSWNLLVAVNGGKTPTVATVQAATLAAVPVGSVIADGQIARGQSSPDLLWIDGARALWIPSEGLAADIGIGIAHQVVPDAAIAPYARGVTLSPWLRCAGRAYFAASGTMWPVSAQAFAGITPIDLGAAACARLRLGTSAELPAVFVKSSSADSVYKIENGKARRISAWDALLRANAGVAPTIVTVKPATLSSIPAGAPIS
ncbi:hypothetical protein [Microbacterium foliorum]|uniref:hypothetical protein n=1 Tax=Microbacterium foliorum TaxID=104336 RepID=UPI0028D523D1|nr:hypothetical protein [Microbacterium foliorum]